MSGDEIRAALSDGWGDSVGWLSDAHREQCQPGRGQHDEKHHRGSPSSRPPVEPVIVADYRSWSAFRHQAAVVPTPVAPTAATSAYPAIVGPGSSGPAMPLN